MQVFIITDNNAVRFEAKLQAQLTAMERGGAGPASIEVRFSTATITGAVKGTEIVQYSALIVRR